ncbi:hypothetical protein [Hyalangium versicolor]|uniref:hypothetical protein n=1 Tax=Hyalangium versicolor TaxID=2861190 RepID=UPI001CCA2184|nr:hypothetical protein [Hyalangium versicolor]
MNRQANAGLFCELYWGESLAEAWSIGSEHPQVLAAPDEKAMLPLYGFTLPEEPFLFAERTEHGYRVFVPPRVKLERSTKGDAFHAVPESQFVQHQGRASVELPEGTTLRLTEGELHLLVSHSVAKDREKVSRLKAFVRVAAVSVLFLSLPLGFLFGGPDPQQMQQSNARAISAAKEKDQARRKALGVDTPLKPIAGTEQKPVQSDGGTPVTVPANLSVQ